MELASYRVNESLCRQIVWTRRQVKREMTECCQILFKTLLWEIVTLSVTEKSFSIVIYSTKPQSHLLKPEQTKAVILCEYRRGKSTSETFSCGRLNKPQRSNGGNSLRLKIRTVRTNCNSEDECRCSGAGRGGKSHLSPSGLNHVFSYLNGGKKTLFSDQITSSQSFPVGHILSPNH